MNRMTRNTRILGAIGIGLVILVALLGARYITLAPMFTSVLYAGLIAITIVYAYFSMETAQATRQQAEASVEMAKEMRQQRIMMSRPVIIQRAKLRAKEEEKKFRHVGSSYCLSHFEIYNAGNGPAIELEISVLNNSKGRIFARREPFLRPSEPPIEFHLSQRARREETNCYLVCEYQSIFSRGKHQTWYQTWLPFKLIKSHLEGEVLIETDELEFHEVSEKDRVDAFRGMSKLEGVYKPEND
jgi:hypothetical protein